MARKKEPLKPISSVRFDFAESLERLCGEAMLMLQMTETIVNHGALAAGIEEMLKERNAALRSALIGEDQ